MAVVYGMQNIHDVFPQAYTGGLRLQPSSGVISGCGLTATVNADTTLVDLAVASGTVRLDTKVFNVTGATLQVTAADGYVNSEGLTEMIAPIITPVRKVPLVAAATDTAFNAYYSGLSFSKTAADGDKLIVGVDSHDLTSMVAIDFYERVSGSWVKFDPTFEPPTYNHFSLPLSDVIGYALAEADEKTIYVKQSKPVNIGNYGASILRAPAGIALARVSYTLTGANASNIKVQPFNIKMVL